jgi:hypothetical protein
MKIEIGQAKVAASCAMDLPIAPLILAKAGTVTDSRTVPDWIREIQEAFRARKTNVLRLAGLVRGFKARLKYCQWSQMWRSEQCLPFGKRTAEKLNLIGEAFVRTVMQNSASLAAEPVAQNSSQLSQPAQSTAQLSQKAEQLPCALETLYYLARLGPEAVMALIADGKITPELTTSEARKLLREHTGQAKDREQPNIKLRLEKTANFICANYDHLNAGLQQWILGRVNELSHQLILRAAGQSNPPFNSKGPVPPPTRPTMSSRSPLKEAA